MEQNLKKTVAVIMKSWHSKNKAQLSVKMDYNHHIRKRLLRYKLVSSTLIRDCKNR